MQIGKVLAIYKQNRFELHLHVFTNKNLKQNYTQVYKIVQSKTTCGNGYEHPQTMWAWQSLKS